MTGARASVRRHRVLIRQINEYLVVCGCWECVTNMGFGESWVVHRVSRSFLRSLPVTCLLPLVVSAQTAQPPDAGQILREALPERVEPTSPPLELRIEAQDLSDITPGGAEVLVSSIRFEGNTQFAEEALMAVLGDEVLGRSYDLGGLRALANNISVFYRESGFSFARAFIPAQDLQDGRLLIQIVEGRYGVIEIDADDPRVLARVQAYLSRLEPGSVIEQAPLERVFAVLGDVPGIRVIPTIAAGVEPGTGDVVVRIEEDKPLGASVSLDNHGNRFSGAYRGTVSLSQPMLFAFGDTLNFTGLYSSEDLRLGSLQYSIPLGTSGLRGRIGYSYTNYDLGQLDPAFTSNTGSSKVTTVGLSYPWVRSATRNLTLSAEYQYKDLENNPLLADDSRPGNRTTARVWPISLRFDQRDGLGGGGLTFGSLILTRGETQKRELPDSVSDDENTLFTKLNLQVVRMQNLPVLPPDWNLYTSLSAQYSNAVLDSSETKSLGGANGVRAYPQGEASGSRGYVAQVELRASMPPLAPYVFADYGRILSYQTEASNSLQGMGLGVRGSVYGITGDFNVAWKVNGKEAQSDTRQKDPRFWFSMSYAF